MKGLSLAKFKKVKEDKDWANLIHEDGHSLMISKGSLSPIHRKQLEKLETYKFADGGKVPHYDQGTPDVEPIDPSGPPKEGDVAAIGGLDPYRNADEPQRSPASDPAAPIGLLPQTPIQAQIPAFNAEKRANIAGATADAKAGSAQANQIQDVQNIIDHLPTQAEIIDKHKQASDRAYNAYKNGDIDPKSYWQDHSRIPAAIGLILSGLGGNTNAAVDNLNKSIDREINLQKNKQDKHLNLWKMNRAALGDDLSANLATQNQLYTGLKYSIEKAALNAKGPINLANALKANALIDQKIQDHNFRFSLLNPTSDNPDPASRVQFLVPPERQQKVVDEINAAKNTVANAPGILEAFDQASKEVRPLTGGLHTSPTAFIPGMKSPGQKALQARLGPTFQDIEGTVRQAAMDNMEHNVTPSFGDDDATIANKRDSLVHYLSSKSAAGTAKSFGIDLQKYPSTNHIAIGSNSPAPPPETKTVNGITYRRGPHGEAIPVKK